VKVIFKVKNWKELIIKSSIEAAQFKERMIKKISPDTKFFYYYKKFSFQFRNILIDYIFGQKYWILIKLFTIQGIKKLARDILIRFRIFNAPNNKENSNTPFVVSSIGEPVFGETWCLIVEDDAIWSNFDKGYPILEQLIQKSHDVITLGITHARYTPEFKLLSGQTTTAYIVQQHYYSALLDNFKEGCNLLIQTGNWPIYALDQYWKRLQQKDNWYCVIPSLMVQRPSYSDIERRHTNYINEFQ
jgi:hypothetical protein